MNDSMYIPTVLEAFVRRIIPSPFNCLGTIVKNQLTVHVQKESGIYVLFY